MPDGGHWEHYDDGYYWWYKEWDAEGNEVENKSGYHHMSGGSGFLLARGTIQDGKDETAPLAGLQGGRADHGPASQRERQGEASTSSGAAVSARGEWHAKHSEISPDGWVRPLGSALIQTGA